MTMTEESTSSAPERYITKADVAAHYSMSVRWVEVITAEGCPSRLIGGRRRYRLSEVDAWLVARGEHAA